MEGPLGEKSKVPAEEMSAELIISSEKPGLRRRNRRQREHFAATEHQEKAALRKLHKRTRSATEQPPYRIWEIPIRRFASFREKRTHLIRQQHPSKIFEVIAEEEEEEEHLLEGDHTYETTESFGSEQSHEEISEDCSEEDNDNNNRDSSAAKSQNNGEIEELREDCLSSLPLEEPSQAEESSSGISTNRGGGGVVVLGQNRGGVFQVEHHDARGKPHQVLGLETNTNQQSVPLWRKLGSKAFLEWVFAVLNVVVEVWQATLTQEADQGKMRHQIYLKLSIANSSFCLVISLVEAFHEGRSSGVKWQRSGYCCWFYYPGSQRQLFGSFALYFGIICSMVQLLVNLMTKLVGEDFVKFDYVPLLLSACYLVARIIASVNKTDFLAVVNCKTHGPNTAKARTVDGGKTWLYECPKCQEDIP